MLIEEERGKEARSVNARQQKQLRIMRRFIIAVYVPYFVILAFTHDILNYSISRIGWSLGGSIWLVLFAMLTVPFMLYQFFFYIRHASRENRLLVILSIVGGALIIIGAAMPFGYDDARVFKDLHNRFSMAGSILSLIVLTIMVSQYCKLKRNRVQLIIYCGFLLVAYMVYQVLRNAALFEVSIALSCFIILYFLNRAVARLYTECNDDASRVESDVELYTTSAGDALQGDDERE